MSRILWLSSLRYLVRHPWQLSLAVLGIALGVAVVVSIDLANDSARLAFTLAAETVAGRATHQVVGGPGGLPEEVYGTLRVELGERLAAPVVEGYVVAPGYPTRIFRLLGIDPFAEGPFRPYFGAGTRVAELASLLARPATTLLAADTARELGLAPGDELVLRVSGERRTLALVGTLQPANEVSRRALADVLVVDVATAQEVLGLVGRLSRIDLILPEGEAGVAALARVQAALPPGIQVVAATARPQALEQMTRAFNLNLAALSLLALVVGTFLIYNTMTFAVVQRRALLGTLRAMGVARGEVFALVLSEALLIGLAGTALGLPLGIVLGRGMVHLITQTINDLYFVLSVRDLAISSLPLLKGVALGLGATLLAALAPALEATAAPPRAILSRSLVEVRARRLAPWAALAGVLALALGVGLLALPSRDLLLSFGGLLAIVIGCALPTPAAVMALMAVCGPAAGGLWGVLGRLAARGVVAALSRTAVAIAALMIAVAVTVGVGIMVDSFRQTLVGWLETTLQADVYVSPPSLVANRSDATLDPALVERLAQAPGVAAVGTYRRVEVMTPNGPTEVVAIQAGPRARAGFRFKEGEPAEVWAAFAGGEVIVSEPFAYHHDLHVGSFVRLPTARGERDLRVAGVFFDYGSDRGVVMLDRATYDQLWDDRGVSSLSIYAAPGIDVDSLVQTLRGLAVGEQEVLIRSNRALREASLVVFERTFAVTGVLRLLAVVVAFVGVLSALMALQLERTREIGVLRACGLTPRQVWGLVAAQTGLLGLAAGLLAWPTGVALALVLIHVINRRSFGWTLQTAIDPTVLLQALLLAVVAAGLAGLYPAWRLARTAPAEALREE